jgi:hypothetical protein
VTVPERLADTCAVAADATARSAKIRRNAGFSERGRAGAAERKADFGDVSSLTQFVSAERSI